MSVDIKKYNEFVRGIELEDLYIDNFTFKRMKLELDSLDTDVPVSIVFKITKNSYETINDRFEISSSVIFRIKRDDKMLFEMKCRVISKYRYKIELNDDLFDSFSKRNLPITLFPFLRELIANSMYRAGLPPILIPFLKN